MYWKECEGKYLVDRAGDIWYPIEIGDSYVTIQRCLPVPIFASTTKIEFPLDSETKSLLPTAIGARFRVLRPWDSQWSMYT